MLKQTLQESISYLLCLAALAGVTLHDTKLDKLATVSASAGVIAAAGADGLLRSNDFHTHVEKVSLHQLAFEQPRMQSRYLEDKRLLTQKKVSKGEHPFDGYYIPG